MRRSHQTPVRSRNIPERGGARLNFLVVVAIIAVVGYVGYQYVPVVYNASLFKVFMQDTVDKAAITSRTSEWVGNELRANAAGYGVPPDAAITVQKNEGRLEARVRWTRPIPLPGYIYQYDFDHTVKSRTSLTQ